MSACDDYQALLKHCMNNKVASSQMIVLEKDMGEWNLRMPSRSTAVAQFDTTFHQVHLRVLKIRFCSFHLIFLRLYHHYYYLLRSSFLTFVVEYINCMREILFLILVFITSFLNLEKYRARWCLKCIFSNWMRRSRAEETSSLVNCASYSCTGFEFAS